VDIDQLVSVGSDRANIGRDGDTSVERPCRRHQEPSDRSERLARCDSEPRTIGCPGSLCA